MHFRNEYERLQFCLGIPMPTHPAVSNKQKKMQIVKERLDQYFRVTGRHIHRVRRIGQNTIDVAVKLASHFGQTSLASVQFPALAVLSL